MFPSYDVQCNQTEHASQLAAAILHQREVYYHHFKCGSKFARRRFRTGDGLALRSEERDHFAGNRRAVYMESTGLVGIGLALSGAVLLTRLIKMASRTQA